MSPIMIIFKGQKVQKELQQYLNCSISFDYQNRNRAWVEYRHRSYIFRRRQYQMLFQGKQLKGNIQVGSPMATQQWLLT